ncbi:MAG: hypothetical protein ABJD11_06230 [Gemmatimonadota bacterium]
MSRARRRDATMELELKARVTDARELRRRLVVASARLSFAGMMRDRRFDRDGELRGRDEVLRIRTFEPDATGEADRKNMVAWKGPTRRSSDGYKQRRELEFSLAGHAPPATLLEALGYAVVEAIDRHVEIHELPGLVLRIEWYPRMDTLLEVEGLPAAIEQGVSISGMPRSEFLPDSLAAFVARYESRTGRSAILAEEALSGVLPGWSRR